MSSMENIDEKDNTILYVLMPLLKKGLSNNEIRIMTFVFENPCSINQISKGLNMDYKNTHRYVQNLHQLGWLNLNPPKSKPGLKITVSIPKDKLKILLEKMKNDLLGEKLKTKVDNLIESTWKKIEKEIKKDEKEN